MAPLPIKGFLTELKALTRAGVTEVETLVKSFKSNIKSLDDIVSTLPVSKNKHGYIELAENSVGKIHEVLRSGDLVELIRVSGKNVPYTSVDVTSFRSLVSDTPELALKDVRDLSTGSKRSFPQLDLKEADLPSMSTTAAKDIKTVEGNLFKYAKQGTTLALTLGAVYVGIDWLTKATEQRKGCFMLTTINGQTTSCKVQAYSCIGTGGNMCSSSVQSYNTTLRLLYVSTLTDTNPAKIRLAAAGGVDVSEFTSKLAQIIDNKYAELEDAVRTEYNWPLDVCGLVHPDIEGGKVPPCRMCSPSDNPISTTYIDPSQFADNITFTCSINPSLLDTIADASKKLGVDLLSGVSSGLKSLVTPLAIFAVLVLAIVVIIFIAKKLMSNSGRQQRPMQYDYEI